MKEYETTTNSTIYRRIRREKVTSCSRCPAHAHENGQTWGGGPKRKKKEFQLDSKRSNRYGR